MKKIILSIALILISYLLIGQITKKSSLEFGYENRVINSYNIEIYDDYNYNMTVLDLTNSLFGELQFGLKYKGIVVYTNVKTYFKPISIDSYRPSVAIYRNGIYYDYKNIRINYERMCAHSIDVKSYRESYSKISIKLNFN